MKTLLAPDVLIRAWLHDPHATTVAAFAISGAFFSVAAWQIQRNLRHNEPGLRLPLALPFALTISAFGLFVANRLPFPWGLPPWEKYALNLLVYVRDEFQNAITASHDGTSDFNVIDRLRDCLLMLVISAQAFESLIPPQTKEQAEVLALNLKNLVMYRAASETDALRCANALGKHWVERATRTVHLDHTSHTYQRTEEFRIRPHEFRSLPDHTAAVRHCTNETVVTTAKGRSRISQRCNRNNSEHRGICSPVGPDGIGVTEHFLGDTLDTAIQRSAHCSDHITHGRFRDRRSAGLRVPA